MREGTLRCGFGDYWVKGVLFRFFAFLHVLGVWIRCSIRVLGKSVLHSKCNTLQCTIRLCIQKHLDNKKRQRTNSKAMSAKAISMYFPAPNSLLPLPPNIRLLSRHGIQIHQPPTCPPFILLLITTLVLPRFFLAHLAPPRVFLVVLAHVAR
jgi:hypothetical protein